MKGNPHIVAVTPLAPAASPITAAEFAMLLQPLALTGVTKLGLAISGGPDSMALALCAARWAKVQACEVWAFIVDHRLRPESRHEAELVKSRCAALGLNAAILAWDHTPVTSRLHVQARHARYDLLAKACHAHGIGHLLLAHQQEDQAETILMRLSKGSGIKGLGGMQPVTSAYGLKLLRPFLTVPKARLTATCQAAGVPYVIDPSNLSPRFARGRLRGIMPLLADEGLTVARLADLGERASAAQQALDHYADQLWQAAVTCHPAGLLTINRHNLCAAPAATALAVLARGLQTVHRTPYDPERQSLLRLYQQITQAKAFQTTSLHGCLIMNSATEIKILREPAAITEVAPLKPGGALLWDQRWHIRLDATYNGGDYTIRALGYQPHDMTEALAPGLRRHIPQGRLRAGLPALWQGSKLLLIPALPSLPWKSPLSAEIIPSEQAI